MGCKEYPAMKLFNWLAVLVVVGSSVGRIQAGGEDDAGFVPLFNGRDLTGWVNVNCAPSTFYVKDNEIITTGKPTGYLRTTRQYENFIAEFDWMHVPPAPGAVGNSGFFVWADPIPAVGTGYTRGIEVQVLVNLTYRDKTTGAITATSQGDLFSIWGATCVPDRPHPLGWARCLPSENHCKGANEWNHYRVEGNNGTIKLAVNGHEVSGLSKCNPRKGYLALESEGSECHFRNLKIKELPSTNPKPNEIAAVDQGYKNLYTGLDLSGWTAEAAEAKGHWQAHDTILHYDGKGMSKGHGLRNAQKFRSAEFIVDFRFPRHNAQPCGFGLRESGKHGGLELTMDPNGGVLVSESLSSSGERFGPRLQPGEWNRAVVSLSSSVPTRNTLKLKVNGQNALWQGTVGAGAGSHAQLSLRPDGEMDFANIFVRPLK
jgi:3-keto-disaccharide hydrolase